MNADKPTPTANSRVTGWSRRAATIGMRREGARVFAARNSGDSSTAERTMMPTTSRRIEARNGRRQPQAMKASGPMSARTAAMTSAETSCPVGAPALVKLAQKPRFFVECSADMSMAPPHSPPMATPWTTRMRMRRTGPMSPACSYVGSKPIAVEAIPIVNMLSTSMRLRPSLSPKWPKTMPPRGRAR